MRAAISRNDSVSEDIGDTESVSKRRRLDEDSTHKSFWSNPLENASPELHLPWIDQFQNITTVGTIQHGRCQHPLSEEESGRNIRTLCVRGLPEWIDENELKAIFIRAKESLLESRFGLSQLNQQCVTSVHLVRDPQSSKCVGYGYVEFIDRKTAQLLLESQSSPYFRIPNCNK